MSIDHPFHEGELFVQQQAGEAQSAQQNGRIIADTISKGALKFIAQQPMVVLGSLDGEQVWASLLFGEPGFMQAADPQSVIFDLSRSQVEHSDPFWHNITYDPRIGSLMIELATRRRLRVNGSVARTAPQQLTLQVAEAYPNCPKYIQRRHFHRTEQSSHPSPPRTGVTLPEDLQNAIASADTFFVASAHPQRNVDVSHRGGNPGFVRLLDEKTLRIPDYPGNSMFNTLGNLALNPQAGLVFPDFQRQRVLQLSGTAEILWQLDDPSHETGGTGRYWNFTVRQWLETHLPTQYTWEFLDYSPFNPS